MVKRRSPMPDKYYGVIQNRILYNRFCAIKNKAKTNGVPFAWEKFADFLDDLAKNAPDGYSPETHRVSFKSPGGGPVTGYSVATMRFVAGKSADRNHNQNAISRSKVKEREVAGSNRDALVSELSVVFLTESGTSEELLDLAKGLTKAA